MVGWHHRLNGHESEQTLGVGEGQGSLACCSPWGRKESDTTEWLNWTDLSISVYLSTVLGFSCGSASRVCLQCRRPRFDSWVGRIPWKRKWQPTPVSLPEKFHGQKSLSGYSLVGRKELDTIEHTCTYLCTSLYATAYTFKHIHTYVHTNRSNDLPLNWIYLDFFHCAF